MLSETARSRIVIATPFPVLLLAGFVLAACGAVEQPVRVERVATSVAAAESLPEVRVNATPEYDRVALEVAGWWEGCVESTPPPSFVARFEGHVMRVVRAGTAQAVQCGATGAVCRCEYRLEASASVPGTGHYRVQIEDESGVRARGTFDVQR